MLDEEETSEIESEGLLGQSRMSLRKDYGNMKTLHFLVAISISLHVVIIGLGLICWVGNKQAIYRSYEHGFASDLGEEIRLV
jgi:hypothetical protein